MVLLVVSLVLALGAAALARNWITRQMTAAANSGPAGTGVVVAAMEIPFGLKVEARHVKLIDLPRDSVPANHFDKSEEVVGQIATQKTCRARCSSRSASPSTWAAARSPRSSSPTCGP
jgi:pilus assembly protein CpaB